MTIFIIMILLVIFWLVYQGIGTEKDTTVHLLGDRLWTGTEIHVYTQSTIKYVSALFRHDKNMPSFSKIREEIKNNYIIQQEETGSQIFYIPLINIAHLIRLRKDEATKTMRMQ